MTNISQLPARIQIQTLRVVVQARLVTVIQMEHNKQTKQSIIPAAAGNCEHRDPYCRGRLALAARRYPQASDSSVG
jgi:hypothetical protein